MRNLLIITFLSLTSQSALAGWTAIASDPIATEYVNFDTVEREDYFVKMWNMSDFKSPQEVGNGKLFKSSKALQEYDCANDKKRLISLVHYIENMGTGQVAYFDSSPDQWRPITAGSLGEVHLKAACLHK